VTSTSALVVGTGLIGTSVGLALRAAGWTVHLVDVDPARAALAADMGAGAAGIPDSPVDVALVAAPPRHTAAALAQAIGGGLAGTYTDVASVKEQVLTDLRELGGDITRYVGGHPVAGRERTGPAGASHDLFTGRPWVLTPLPDQRADDVAVVRALVVACGASPVVMTVEEHDRALAAVSHLPQLVASALAAGLLDADPQAVPIAGQGLRDMVRIAASDPELWADIAAANADPLAAGLQGLIDRLAQVQQRLAAGDPATVQEAVRRLLIAGNEGQARLPGKHGGASRDFATVAVVVSDQPGQLARLLVDAGDCGVNVEDLRVEHTPGRPTGVIELFVEPGVADTLRTALRERGWSAH
jgi:prephenate dehydrogenase